MCLPLTAISLVTGLLRKKRKPVTNRIKLL